MHEHVFKLVFRVHWIFDLNTFKPLILNRFNCLKEPFHEHCVEIKVLNFFLSEGNKMHYRSLF